MLKIKHSIFLTLSVLFISNCGDSTTTSNKSSIVKGEMLNITQDNKNKVISTLFGSLGSVDEIDSIKSRKVSNQNKVATINLNLITNIVKNEKKININCDSGSIEVDDSNYKVVYKNCNIKGTTIDGTIQYSQKPTSTNIDATISNLSIKKDNAQLYYESAHVIVNNNNKDTTITGYGKLDNKSIKYLDLHTHFKQSNSEDTISIDGSVSSTCLNDKWVDIQTIKNIKFTKDENGNKEDCPDEGEVKIKGDNSDIKVVYNNDLSATLYLNGELDNNYRSCKELTQDAIKSCSN